MKKIILIILILLNIPAWVWAFNLVTGSAVTAGPSKVAYDNFTDDDATTLADHTSDSSHTWGKVAGNTGNLTINANTLYSSSADTVNTYYSSFTPADAEYIVKATIYSSASGGTTPYVCGRVSTTERTGYCVNWTDGNWSLRQWVNGTRTDLATYAGDTPTTAKVVKLEITDAAKKVYIDDVERINYTTDNTITAAGRPGLATYYSDASTARNLDTWEVWE
jgi:hypothetical protein